MNQRAFLDALDAPPLSVMTSNGLLLSPFRQVVLVLVLSLSAFSANYVAAAHLIVSLDSTKGRFGRPPH